MWWPEESEIRHRILARMHYDVEMWAHSKGVCEFVYDEAEDVFRFVGGEFAFSRERINVERMTREERLYSLE